MHCADVFVIKIGGKQSYANCPALLASNFDQTLKLTYSGSGQQNRKEHYAELGIFLSS